MSKTFHNKSDDKPGTPALKASQKNTPPSTPAPEIKGEAAPKQAAVKPAAWIAAPADVVRLAESAGMKAETRGTRVSLWKANKRVGKVEGSHGILTYLGKDARKDHTVKIDSMKALEAFIGQCGGIVKDWVAAPKKEKVAKEAKVAPVKQATKKEAPTPVRPQAPRPHDPIKAVTQIAAGKKTVAPPPPAKVIGKVTGKTPFSK